eukprot:gene6398-biopygen5883
MHHTIGRGFTAPAGRGFPPRRGRRWQARRGVAGGPFLTSPFKHFQVAPIPLRLLPREGAQTAPRARSGRAKDTGGRGETDIWMRESAEMSNRVRLWIWLHSFPRTTLFFWDCADLGTEWRKRTLIFFEESQIFKWYPRYNKQRTEATLLAQEICIPRAGWPAPPPAPMIIPMGQRVDRHAKARRQARKVA